ncbi:MAG: DUF4282 domain-containing protein [Alcanivoracaceae bacterium]|jgi:hypothetical protein|nr:DUF4282 domain-containing protein [Alcanivoracaceae bacterium]
MVSPEQPSNEKSVKEPKDIDHGVTRVRENYSRMLFWCVQYWRELLNFKFDKYMIVQVLPGVYGILLVALLLSILTATVLAFMQSIWLGIGFMILPAPLIFLVVASILRALLEFYLVVFRISEHVDELVGLRDTVDRLSGISDTVDDMVSLTRLIPFWKAMSRRSNRRTVPEPRRRRQDHDQDLDE